MELSRIQGEAAALPPLPCMNASLRRAARAVSQSYETEFRTARMRATQFTLLEVIKAQEGITQSVLGQLLALDSTTLSRTLAPLEKRGWIRSLPGEDRRERRLMLTPSGRRQLNRARPHWERAQEQMRKRLGATQWEQVMRALLRVTQAAHED